MSPIRNILDSRKELKLVWGQCFVQTTILRLETDRGTDQTTCFWIKILGRGKKTLNGALLKRSYSRKWGRRRCPDLWQFWILADCYFCVLRNFCTMRVKQRASYFYLLRRSTSPWRSTNNLPVWVHSRLLLINAFGLANLFSHLVVERRETREKKRKKKKMEVFVTGTEEREGGTWIRIVHPGSEMTARIRC